MSISTKIRLNTEAREKLKSGVNKIADAVESTLGPKGLTVLMESMSHVGGVTSTKDGVSVAKQIVLEDKVANLGAKVLKEACKRTADNAGDGTTTSIVIARAIVNAGLELIEKKKVNVHELVRDLEDQVDLIVDYISSITHEVDDSKLEDVATISANNDERLGAIVAEAFSSVDNNGVVTFKESDSDHTTVEVVDGFKFDRGFLSPMFANDSSYDTCRLEKPYVILTDIKIASLGPIQATLEECVKKNRSLVIIGHVDDRVKENLIRNKIGIGLKVCVVPPPSTGWRTTELMSDLSVLTGATYKNKESGDNLDFIDEKTLGVVDSITITRDETSIVLSKENKPDTTERVAELRKTLDKVQDPNFVEQRIALLTGKAAVIHVGGVQDFEKKERYDRVEDAVCAVKSALEEGVVPGGGRTLQLAVNAINIKGISKDVIEAGLIAPSQAIFKNAGLKGVKTPTLPTDVIDARTGERVDMFESGIIDPAKVTKNAIKNAVSAASTILTTGTVITYESKSSK